MFGFKNKGVVFKIERKREFAMEYEKLFTPARIKGLTFPNRITLSDFDGWVQERGLYFASEWDPRYQTIISSHDPGEAPLAGGILYTPYGDGNYIYAAYSWFRQLPAGVAGAYKLFINLISVGVSR